MTVERVEELVVELPHCELPAHLRLWLLDGFTRYLGGDDLHEALDLHSHLRDRRNELLRLVVALTPAARLRDRIAFVLDCLHGDARHPDQTARKFIDRLRTLDVRLPRSMKHLRRLVEDDELGTKISFLSPDWHALYNVDITDEQELDDA